MSLPHVEWPRPAPPACPYLQGGFRFRRLLENSRRFLKFLQHSLEVVIVIPGRERLAIHFQLVESGQLELAVVDVLPFRRKYIYMTVIVKRGAR